MELRTRKRGLASLTTILAPETKEARTVPGFFDLSVESIYVSFPIPRPTPGPDVVAFATALALTVMMVLIVLIVIIFSYLLLKRLLMLTLIVLLFIVEVNGFVNC